MKQAFFFLVIFAFTATTAFADNDKPITVDQLPASAKQFIDKYFSNTKISYAKKESEIFDKSYEVIFTDGNKVEFNKNGEWSDVDCKFTQVPVEIIPQKIREYVSQNYNDQKILEIDRDKKKYEIKLSSGLELKFDSKFNLTEIDN